MLSRLDLIAALQVEAECTCDPDMRDLLEQAATMLSGSAFGEVCPHCNMRQIVTNGLCRACYVRQWSKAKRDKIAKIATGLLVLFLCSCDPDKPTPSRADAGAEVVDPYGDGEEQ